MLLCDELLTIVVLALLNQFVHGHVPTTILWFTFSEEVIIEFQYFFQKFTKHSTFNSKDRYVLAFVKISYYHKNMPYISC